MCSKVAEIGSLGIGAECIVRKPSEARTTVVMEGTHTIDPEGSPSESQAMVEEITQLGRIWHGI